VESRWAAAGFGCRLSLTLSLWPLCQHRSAADQYSKHCASHQFPHSHVVLLRCNYVCFNKTPPVGGLPLRKELGSQFMLSGGAWLDGARLRCQFVTGQNCAKGSGGKHHRPVQRMLGTVGFSIFFVLARFACEPISPKDALGYADAGVVQSIACHTN
jgi:hypothetical protein